MLPYTPKLFFARHSHTLCSAGAVQQCMLKYLTYCIAWCDYPNKFTLFQTNYVFVLIKKDSQSESTTTKGMQPQSAINIQKHAHGAMSHCTINDYSMVPKNTTGITGLISCYEQTISACATWTLKMIFVLTQESRHKKNI